VYGEPLRIPGELLTPTADPVDPVHLITQLRQHMARPRPVPAAHHASPATFVHKDLHNCTHVFLHQDATRRALEPPYSGPYQVLSRREKTLQLLMRGRPITMSADRVKPAYVLNETDCGSTTSKSSANTPATPHPATPPQLPRLHAPVATSASPHVLTPKQQSPQGGDVGISHKAVLLQEPAKPALFRATTNTSRATAA
jgi:hypothetical protein